MTQDERDELIAGMSDKTPMGRFNPAEIAACFDGLVALGYDIVKRPAVVEAPEPTPEPEPVKPVKAEQTKTHAIVGHKAHL